MQLIVPYLFPSARLLETAAQDLRLPAFEILLARGRLAACAAEGVEAQVCAELGIPRQQDYPIAPITLLADKGVAGEHYWLRADPVHLRVMRDRIVLADSGVLAISAAEAEALAQAIGAHFGAAFSPIPLHPARWYLRLDTAPQLSTTPVSMAAGCDIDPLLPTGEDAMRFRGVLNELQMLLFEHPVNQAREARGELPVNALWLWGGGRLPTPPGKTVLLSDGAEVQALAQFCGNKASPSPGHFSASLLESNPCIVLSNLKEAGQYGDMFGWREAITTLERAWFAPLLAYLRWHPATVRVIDPVHGKALVVNTTDIWKVWRRPRALR